MFNGLRVFPHRAIVNAESPVDDSAAGQSVPDYGIHHPSHGWPRHPLEERRSKKRDECFRGLVELEAELLHEVEREI
jgi:hypothetical protein